MSSIKTIRALSVLAGAAWLLGAGCPARSPSAPAEEGSPKTPAAPSARPALKGQTHAHSSRSGDSQTPPEAVARWYADRGYDFLVFTDHDAITAPPSPEGLLVIPGVELTQNSRDCDPPPEPGMACLLHVNALFVDPTAPARISWPAAPLSRRLDIFSLALSKTRDLGGLAQINHPNFHYAADAALIAELGRRGALLLEIANEAVDSNNAGDADHPPVEALWDAALDAGARIYGVASDDAHHYDDAEAVRATGEVAHTGDRGFVMVWAERSAPAIRAAMARGDFYSSTGALIDRVEVADGALLVAVAAGQGPHRVDFIGPGGRTLASSSAPVASHPIPEGPGARLRALVTLDRGQKAWTQPAWRD